MRTWMTRPFAAARSGVLGAALLACSVALLLASPAPSPAAGVHDWMHIWEVVRLVDYQQDQAPSGLFVYYLGDSIGRESTVNDRSWTRQLARKAGAAGRVKVFAAHDVSGHNQTFGMDEQIVRGLPRTPDGQPAGIVLIGVGISRFIGPPKSMLPAVLEPVSPGVRPPLSRWAQHQYDGRRPLPLSRKRELVDRWMGRRWTGFAASKTQNLAAIRRVIAICRDKGLRPVLIDLPLDLRVVGNSLGKPRSFIRSACTKLARREHIPYLQFNRSLGLPTPSFWDMHHLLRPGYRRWQARLSAEIVKLLPRAAPVR
jgi:hypothetical protein